MKKAQSTNPSAGDSHLKTNNKHSASETSSHCIRPSARKIDDNVNNDAERETKSRFESDRALKARHAKQRELRTGKKDELPHFMSQTISAIHKRTSFKGKEQLPEQSTPSVESASSTRTRRRRRKASKETQQRFRYLQTIASESFDGVPSPTAEPVTDVPLCRHPATTEVTSMEGEETQQDVSTPFAVPPHKTETKLDNTDDLQSFLPTTGAVMLDGESNVLGSEIASNGVIDARQSAGEGKQVDSKAVIQRIQSPESILYDDMESIFNDSSEYEDERTNATSEEFSELEDLIFPINLFSETGETVTVESVTVSNTTEMSIPPENPSTTKPPNLLYQMHTTQDNTGGFTSRVKQHDSDEPCLLHCGRYTDQLPICTPANVLTSRTTGLNSHEPQKSSKAKRSRGCWTGLYTELGSIWGMVFS